MAKTHPLVRVLEHLMIKDVPSYGNKFWYSLGFLSMISLVLLAITGGVMAFYGPTWWLTSGVGAYVRSVHLWATQAFVLFIFLHLLIVFLTSGFKKPRRLTWMIGVLMLFAALGETEFGYALRGDFSSQWRALQGADFYNGAGAGGWLNPLNYGQIYGVHVVVVPAVILGLLAVHYLLVRVLGIAMPYRPHPSGRVVPASHTKLFARGGVLLVLIMALAAFVPSPFIKATTIQAVAQQDPYIIGKTLMAEFNATSDTATYMDNIDPYRFNTRDVYIAQPYQAYVQTQAGQTDQLRVFDAELSTLQDQQLKAAADYYNQDAQPPAAAPVSPVTSIIASLTTMASSGLYESALASANAVGSSGDATTHVTRFLADTGVLEHKAGQQNITTEQYGMVREETGSAPGAWWLTPIGLLNHTVLATDDNGDRDAAIIFGSLLLVMLAFPFIPYLNRIPDVLQLWRLIWRDKRN